MNKCYHSLLCAMYVHDLAHNAIEYVIKVAIGIVFIILKCDDLHGECGTLAFGNDNKEILWYKNLGSSVFAK